MADFPHYDDFREALADLALAHSPAGYHGLLTAALCVAPDATKVDLLHLARGDVPAAVNAQAQALLAALRDATVEGLSGFQGGFQPLLPSDDEALAARAEALAQWCEGFTFGLGSDRRVVLDERSPEVREIVRDLVEMTRAEMTDGEAEDEEESAYAELVEYVRVGAQLIYVELHA